MAGQHNKKSTSRTVTILIIVVLVLIGFGVYSHSKNQTGAPPPSSAKPSAPVNGTLLPNPKTISHFQLHDEVNNSFTNQNLKGHWTLMFFGFTHCGDVCPTTLAELNKMYQQLEKDLPADALPQVALVTVDPERDTIPILHDYIKKFNPNFKGLHPDPQSDTLNLFNKEIGLSYAKVNQGDSSYGMQHSSQLFLFNPDGNWVGILNYPFQSEQLVKDFKTIININHHNTTE